MPGSKTITRSFIPDFRLRGRTVELTLFLPARGRKLPVVVFSHGNPVPPRHYFYLGRVWARAGIATVFLHHPADGEDLSSSENWLIRARDLRALIGSLRRICPRLGSRIGVAGHSHGAYAAAILAGLPIHVGKSRVERCADRRARAFLLLSPPRPGELGTRASEWSRLRGPALLIAGERERTSRSWARIFPSRGTDLWLARRAGHLSFIDAAILRGSKLRRPDRAVLRETAQVSLRFWLKALASKASP